jgi:5-formyltetrahydrofolate cyclo-ligase
VQGERLLFDEKRALRRAMTERRQKVPTDERARACADVNARLQSLPEVAAAGVGGRTVAGFVALVARGEIDPAPTLAAAHAAGARVVLPRVSAQSPRLRFHDADPTQPEALAAGPYGLLEPEAHAPEVGAEDVDVMILPGLAFDRRGRRLGYGGGYYDEAAGRLRAAGRGFLVGVAFDFQMVDECPAGPADVRVDCVVTDRQVVRCAGEQA